MSPLRHQSICEIVPITQFCRYGHLHTIMLGSKRYLIFQKITIFGILLSLAVLLGGVIALNFLEQQNEHKLLATEKRHEYQKRSYLVDDAILQGYKYPMLKGTLTIDPSSHRIHGLIRNPSNESIEVIRGDIENSFESLYLYDEDGFFVPPFPWTPSKTDSDVAVIQPYETKKYDYTVPSGSFVGINYRVPGIYKIRMRHLSSNVVSFTIK